MPLSEEERADKLASLDRWIYKAMRDAKGPAREREDVAQELRLEIWKASAKFDPSRGIEFITFASGVMRSKLAELRGSANGNSVATVLSKRGEVDATYSASELYG